MTIMLAVDGIDATGKTTVLNALRTRAPNVQLVGEFSNTELGDLIRSLVSRRRFFDLARSGDQAIAAAESFLILSDTLAKFESVAQESKASAVVFERGFLSVLGYQLIRLRNRDSLRLANVFQRTVLAAVSRLRESEGFQYIEVLLTAPINIVAQRVQRRGEGKLTSTQFSFLSSAQSGMMEFAAAQNWPILENVASHHLESIILTVLDKITVSDLKRPL